MLWLLYQAVDHCRPLFVPQKTMFSCFLGKIASTENACSLFPFGYVYQSQYLVFATMNLDNYTLSLSVKPESAKLLLLSCTLLQNFIRFCYNSRIWKNF